VYAEGAPGQVVVDRGLVAREPDHGDDGIKTIRSDMEDVLPVPVRIRLALRGLEELGVPEEGAQGRGGAGRPLLGGSRRPHGVVDAQDQPIKDGIRGRAGRDFHERFLRKWLAGGRFSLALNTL
jgi:hypothetical protein